MRDARLVLSAAAGAAVAMLVVVTITSSSNDRPRRVAPAIGAPLRWSASTDARIARQQMAVRARPQDPDGYSALAAAYVQKVRETGDVAFYRRAGEAVGRALELQPANAVALTQRGILRLARHDFRGALQDGRRAHRLAPEVVMTYGVIVDALVELGRYGEGARTLQQMVDLKPDLDSYARVSYVRELHGDVSGAVEAMRLAISASGGAPENTAYVQTLLGNLEFARGRYGAARRAYQQALARFPGYVRAQAGLAHVQAADGQLGAAIRSLRAVVRRLPLPEYVVALGETELAAGRHAAARRDLALVEVQQRLLRGAGINTDVELAVYDADHGDRARAVRLARDAWRAAPSVRAADALAWSLTRSGAARKAMPWTRRALKLGTRDPIVLFHAGMTALAAGQRRQARTLLRRALRTSPRFSALNAPRARRALAAL